MMVGGWRSSIADAFSRSGQGWGTEVVLTDVRDRERDVVVALTTDQNRERKRDEEERCR